MSLSAALVVMSLMVTFETAAGNYCDVLRFVFETHILPSLLTWIHRETQIHTDALND